MLIFVLALLMLSGGWSSPHANLEIPPLPKFGKALDAASASIDNACFVGAYRVEVDQAKGAEQCSGWKQCELGFYCLNGGKHPCPAGRYGSTTGLKSPDCSGPCPPGHYCPPQTTNGEDYLCGNSAHYCPSGSESPAKVRSGFYSTGNGNDRFNSTRTGESLCEAGSYCVGGIKQPCPAGRYGLHTGMGLNSFDYVLQGDRSNRCVAEGSSIITTVEECRNAAAFLKINFFSDPGGFSNKSVPSGCVYRAGSNQYNHKVLFNTHPNTHLNMVEEHNPKATGWETVCSQRMPCSGICHAGYYCPAGSTSPRQYQCNGMTNDGAEKGLRQPVQFCPEGSGIPQILQEGGHAQEAQPNAHFALPPSGTVTKLSIRTGEELCLAGHYCLEGLSYKCPAGRYGLRRGETNPLCTGPCLEGYYCPEGSISAKERKCMGTNEFCPPASRSPAAVRNGFFTISSYSDEFIALQHGKLDSDVPSTMTHEAQCGSGRYCIDGVAFKCPAGRYGSEAGLTSSECTGACEAGYFCPIGSVTKRHSNCSSPAVFCPEGSVEPLPVHEGYYTIGGDEQHRWDEVRCELGHWCTGGTRKPCPSGRYGASVGLHSETCTGICAPGYYCPPASFEATQKQCGGPHLYCPEGSSTPIPVLSGYHTVRGGPPALYTVELSVDDRVPFSSCRNASNYSRCINRWDPVRKFRIVEDPDPSMNIRSTQIPCSPGYFCIAGVRFICPSGRYGSLYNETRSACEGVARAGHFTSPGSTTPTQYKCGERMLQAVFCPEGSTTPHPVREGFWTTSPNVKIRNTSTECHRNNSDCVTIAYDELHYILYNDDGDLKTRTAELPCPAGSWCRDGHRFQVPPGRYGRSTESTKPLGDGTCQKGFYCKSGSTTPMEHGCGHADVYCPEGSGSPTPVDQGYFTSLGWEYISEVQHNSVEPMAAPSPKHGNTSLKYEQKLCEVGHWCHDGIREACPRGRYGSTTGLHSILCSGPCKPGYICPVGSYQKDQLECGHNQPYPSSVFCPSGDNDVTFVDKKSPANTGSWKYVEVDTGYYSIGGEGITNKTRFAQRPCEPGHYCDKGIKIRCPAGRYGKTWKLDSIDCTGECDAGYYCPPGSNSSTQKECGDIEGARSPCYVTPTGLVESTRRSGERRCEYPHADENKRWPKMMEDYGNGWKTVHHYENEWLQEGQPRHFHFHISQQHRSRTKSSGLPASVYCPKGSSLPTNVRPGYYTIGGNNATNRTRVEEVPCKTGHFCEQGMIFQCPPGRYGSVKGLTEEHCSGFCPPGHRCGWNTTTPEECAQGYYSSGGWAYCMKCPRNPRTESVQTCKTGRKCCSM